MRSIQKIAERNHVHVDWIVRHAAVLLIESCTKLKTFKFSAVISEANLKLKFYNKLKLCTDDQPVNLTQVQQ